MIRTTITGYFDLDYVVLVDVPVRDSKFGQVIAVDPAIVERRIAEEIIKQGVPLRGREVAFLRKSLGLSYEKFANRFGRTAGTVFRWEKKPDERMDQLVEAGLRSFFAEQLDVQLAGRFSLLKGKDEAPEKLEVELPKAA